MKYNELDAEILSNINPFEENNEIPNDFTECLNHSSIETNQNSFLIDPITNFEQNKFTLRDPQRKVQKISGGVRTHSKFDFFENISK